MDALWRLVWALPLVLVVGAAAILILRRLVAPGRSTVSGAPRMALCGSLALSDDTRVHLVEVDRKPLLVVESARRAVVHAINPAATEVARPPWLRRLQRAASR